ncbi:MAG: Ribosome maturation factor RimP [Elusimicrobia bacterium]|nr:Ribosome maturation factor RimP [Elusimicrobiota bacterium]
MSDLLTKIETVVTPVLEKEQVELVDLTYQKSHGGWTLSFYLDKPGGITLDDCESWSRRLEPLIEGAGLIERSYVLEVASPGIDRAIRKLKDFEKFGGEKVHVKLFSPLEGQKNFHGILLGADEQVVRLEMDGAKRVELPRNMIAKCRLNPTINF